MDLCRSLSQSCFFLSFYFDYKYAFSIGFPFPAAETAKSEPSEYSQDFLCIESTSKDVTVLPSPSFSPTLSLSSDDTLIDTLSPPQSSELMIPLQEKLPSGMVDIRLDDLLDWSGEQTLQLDSKQMDF